MKKYVITGGPCSGKTTVINELKKRGILVLDETAREILDENKGIGTLELQLEIFKRQFLRETELEKRDGYCILDRGIIDVFAYSEYHLGSIPRGLNMVDFKNFYDGVFILDRLPFVNDGTRVEKGESEAETIHKKIIDTYAFLGYSKIHIPVIKDTIESSVRKRADIIMEHIKYDLSRNRS